MSAKFTLKKTKSIPTTKRRKRLRRKILRLLVSDTPIKVFGSG